jgi:hypothetical protein
MPCKSQFLAKLGTEPQVVKVATGGPRGTQPTPMTRAFHQPRFGPKQPLYGCVVAFQVGDRSPYLGQNLAKSFWHLLELVIAHLPLVELDPSC